MNPFLKWPGGKGWLTKIIKGIVPQQYSNYYEPFLGGGAVFFSLTPENGTISDINPELINLYIVMRDFPSLLKEQMRYHHMHHNDEYYYTVRATHYANPVEQAARLLYLNRTCYNGLYRVNHKGEFNVPIGTKSNCIYDIDVFEKYALALKKMEITTDDFAVTIQKATAGDLIFADPPYASAQKKNNSFLKYNDKLFTWDDQVRLHKELVASKKRGATVILTNADNLEIQNMYVSSDFYVKEVIRTSNVAGVTEKRTAVSELLITSFPL